MHMDSAEFDDDDEIVEMLSFYSEVANRTAAPAASDVQASPRAARATRQELSPQADRAKLLNVSSG